MILQKIELINTFWYNTMIIVYHLYNMIAPIILIINIPKLRNIQVKFLMLNKFCIVGAFCIHVMVCVLMMN